MTIDNYTDRELQREIERLTAELELAKMKTYAASISPIAKERDELRAALAERDAKGKTMIDFELQATGIPESIEQYQLALDAAFNAGKAIAAGAAPVPTGWQTVPVEPTLEMCITGDAVWVDCARVYDCTGTRSIYKAMLVAAPKEPT